MIPKNTIDEIFETVKIEEVISDFITLKKRGVNLLGLCPFHNEKTPSFTVSPAKGIYKGFGCGEGGNSVSFFYAVNHKISLIITLDCGIRAVKQTAYAKNKNIDVKNAL